MNTTPKGLERLREDMLADCRPGPIFTGVCCAICVCLGLLLLPWLLYVWLFTDMGDAQAMPDDRSPPVGDAREDF